MRKNVFLILLISSLMMSVVIGCSRRKWISSSKIFTDSLIPFSELVDGEELLILKDEEFLNAIDSLCYQENSNSLYAVYSNKGPLAHWDIKLHRISNTFHIGTQSSLILQFTRDCEILAGTTQVESRQNHENIKIEYIDDFRTWSTTDGEELTCFGDCEMTHKYPLQIGATIDFLGDNYLLYSEVSYSLLKKSGISKASFISSFEYTSPRIGKIVFSPTSLKFVIAYMEGGISIENDEIFGTRWIQRNISEEKKPIQALVMDPTEQYIARIRDNYLTVWSFNFLQKKEIINARLEEEQLLAFDQSGQFLFVGGNDHIQVWDLAQTQIVKDIEANAISAMVVSQDNRLLIWGNENGEIHVWGSRIE